MVDFGSVLSGRDDDIDDDSVFKDSNLFFEFSLNFFDDFVIIMEVNFVSRFVVVFRVRILISFNCMILI